MRTWAARSPQLFPEALQARTSLDRSCCSRSCCPWPRPPTQTLRRSCSSSSCPASDGTSNSHLSLLSHLSSMHHPWRLQEGRVQGESCSHARASHNYTSETFSDFDTHSENAKLVQPNHVRCWTGASSLAPQRDKLVVIAVSLDNSCVLGGCFFQSSLGDLCCDASLIFRLEPRGLTTNVSHASVPVERAGGSPCNSFQHSIPQTERTAQRSAKTDRESSCSDMKSPICARSEQQAPWTSMT